MTPPWSTNGTGSNWSVKERWTKSSFSGGGGGGGVTGPIDEYEEVWFPAWKLEPISSTYNAFWANPTAGTRKATTGKSAHYDYLACSDSKFSGGVGTLKMPDDFDEGTDILIRPYWESSTTSGGVVWSGSAKGTSDNQDLDDDDNAGGLASAQTVSISSRYLNIGNIITIDNTATEFPSAGELAHFAVFRYYIDSNDTLVGDANLIGFNIQFRRLSANNAQW